MPFWMASMPLSAVSVEGACRKAARRILPFLFLLYVMSYLDRANVAFARVPMAEELGFSDATYGLGTGLFFLGYFFLGLPGALIVERWGARRWIGYTMAGWGVATLLFALVKTPSHFYLCRILLGLTAAGFFPGVIVYLTHWFPQRDRSRALAGFMMAAPVSLIIGGPLAALILHATWPWSTAWRWIFILQGLPTILLGIVTLFVLSDSPQDASWLEQVERDLIEEALASETKSRGPQPSWWGALRERNVTLLSVAHVCANIAGYGFIFWLPSTIKTTLMLGPGMADAVSALPFGLSLLAMWFASRSSDRTGERKLHAIIPMSCAAFFFGLTVAPGQPRFLILVWLCLAGACVFAWVPGFWVLPTTISTGSSRAASIGIINSVGNLGGFIGPAVIGYLLTKTHSPLALVLLVSLSYCAAAILTACVSLPNAEARASVT